MTVPKPPVARADVPLENFRDVARAIAAVFGRQCEVVLHSLTDPERSVIFIENGDITGRDVGAPMTDYGLRLLEQAGTLDTGLFGPYASVSRTGNRLKSVTVMLRDRENRPVGMLCINFNVSAPLDEFARTLLNVEASEGDAVEEFFPSTVSELVEYSVARVVSERSQQTSLSPTERNKEIVAALARMGVFQVKNGVDIVADHLGISRYSVYNYLREIRFKAR